MEFEWSEAERAAVLHARGIDFVRLANDLFDGRSILSLASPRDGEDRFVAIGPSDNRLFAVVWMWRGPSVRIITARRARDGEERRYRALYR
jgi:uncharacterized DUF497 family protein